MRRSSILQAIEKGLISDQTMACIWALRHARARDERLDESIKAMLRFVADMERTANISDPAKESPGEGAEAPASVPASIIRYLEEQHILLIPLQIGSSSIADAGKLRNFRYRLHGRVGSREMYDLNEHGIGLYFDIAPELPEKYRADKAFFHPDTIFSVNNTGLNFVDANLRGATIDLFYEGLKREFRSHRIFCLNIGFKNCWVKGMKLAFWRSVAAFPGSITFVFEDCEDFDAQYFPYLRREIAGNHYYLDLEKFADETREIASPKFLQHIEDILRLSLNYRHEHLR